jgi:hypothetical protein
MLVLTQDQATAQPRKKDSPEYVSNLVIGYSQVSQWYPAFESVVDGDRWELLWHGGAGVDRWSDPKYAGWFRRIESPCNVRSGDPDRVVLSISGPYGDDEDQWVQKIQGTVNVIRAKYKNVKQIVLQPVVGGPGSSRAARQHPVIVKAIERVVKTDTSGIVSRGPSPQVSSARDYRDRLGHLTRQAAGSIGKQIGEHYKKLASE